MFCLVAMDPRPGVEAHSLGTASPDEMQTPHFTDEEPCPNLEAASMLTALLCILEKVAPLS